MLNIWQGLPKMEIFVVENKKKRDFPKRNIFSMKYVPLMGRVVFATWILNICIDLKKINGQVQVFYFCCTIDYFHAGQAVFVPHALLLRGTLYALWREDEKGLKDLQDLINTAGVDKQVYSKKMTS